MLGVSGLISTSGDGGAAPAEAPPPPPPESGGGETGPVSFSEDDGGGVGGERSNNSGGNRWPRQETLALLKIRSDMDANFRDSSHKAPLWEEVSRKMAELGYHRSSKKCKEKFENVYKYHKRTKDGRATKSDGGKSYRFFDQLEAFESNNSSAPNPPPQPPPRHPPPLQGNNLNTHISTSVVINPPVQVAAPGQVTVTSAQIINPSQFPPPPRPQNLPPPPAANVFPPHWSNNSSGSPLWDSTSSSSTSSDEDIHRRRRRKRKRKEFFEKLMRNVAEKQEQMQKKFLEAIEKRENERVVREEAWRAQEMARINRDREILAQERSMAAAKDAAVIKFVQKIAEQHNIQIPTTVIAPQTQPPLPPPQPQAPAAAAPQPISVAPPATHHDNNNNNSIADNFITSMSSPSSSRWPKIEIEELIRIRTCMDSKYQDNGPKGPLWEEVAAEMKKLGYNRNAKRCKEKWENINKYYKKVKESNKKRPEDSKTCPYFHQLDALYKERAKNEASFNNLLQPESSPIMARPEQQWPPMPGHNDNINEEDDETDDDNDNGGGGYEVLPIPGTTGAAATTTGTAE